MPAVPRIRTAKLKRFALSESRKGRGFAIAMHGFPLEESGGQK